MIDLSKIRVLYRQPVTMALLGIPYAMRPGQSPRGFERGREEAIADYHRAAASGHFSARWPEPLGWTWLGSPGWWGEIGPEDRAAIETWLKTLSDVPTGPGEWCEVQWNDLRKPAEVSA